MRTAPLFYNINIGPFPPYNRHYESDAGAFLLPLLWAARSLRPPAADPRGLTDALPLVVFAGLLILTSQGDPARNAAPLPPGCFQG